jgi:hypothetical protein
LGGLEHFADGDEKRLLLAGNFRLHIGEETVAANEIADEGGVTEQVRRRDDALGVDGERAEQGDGYKEGTANGRE